MMATVSNENLFVWCQVQRIHVLKFLCEPTVV